MASATTRITRNKHNLTETALFEQLSFRISNPVSFDYNSDISADTSFHASSLSLHPLRSFQCLPFSFGRMLGFQLDSER